MNRTLHSITLIVLVFTTMLASAGTPEYRVVLEASATSDDPESAAAELSAAYGGTVLGRTGEAFRIRISESRAKLLAADPRVAAVDTAGWTNGVRYDYDGSGNVMRAGDETFVYDTANRLVRASIQDTTRDYGYDAFGNRTGCREESPSHAPVNCQGGYVVDPATNRLNVSYDARGNLEAFEGRSYAYDAVNMMTREEQAGTGIVRELVYTASDERLAVRTITAGGWWRWTVRDPAGKVLRELTSQDGAHGIGADSWQWMKDYVWRDGQLLATRQWDGSAVTTYHYHLDHLGTPRRITDSRDRVVGVHDYHAFGADLPSTTNEASTTRFKFTGHERDTSFTPSVADLDYMMARYYSPRLGRFLSVDPFIDTAIALKNPQGWNRYAYVRNNPVNKTDPTGKCEDPGRGEGGKRICIQTFIPTKTFGGFSGDNRGPQSNGGTFRTSQTLTLTPGGHGAAKQKFEPGVSKLGPLERKAEVAKQEVKGTPEGVNVQVKASDGVLFGAAPNIGYNLTLKPASDGSVQVTGTHSGYPGLEVWMYQDGQKPQLLYSHDPAEKGLVGGTRAIGQTVVIPEEDR